MSDSATQGTVFHQAPLSMDSPGKRTGVGSHAFLQGILPTQGLNLQLLYLFALAGRFFTTRATWEPLGREGVQLHPSADNWIKTLLNMALPTRARPSFPHCQSLPSGNLHNSPSLIHQKTEEARREQSCSCQNENHITES